MFASLKYLTFNGRCDRLIRGKKGQKKKKGDGVRGEKKSRAGCSLFKFYFFFLYYAGWRQKKHCDTNGRCWQEKKKKKKERNST